MKIVKLIETDAEYEAALARIDALFDAPKNTPEGQELELLVVLVNHYEAIHYPIPAADPVEAIKYRMEELGWTTKDLEALLGDKATVSRILNRKRELTVEMMRKLSVRLRIPAEILLQTGLVIFQ
jgi:HTH-type transcriptional regulator/antitoxin HigA